MEIGVLPLEDPGVFRSLLLPETADALAAGEPVTALALTEDALALGAAAGYLEGGRFQLSSLYVAPNHRRRGGGRLLVETLSRLLEKTPVSMEINFIVTREEHETLPAFLEALGFQEETGDGEDIYRLLLSEVASSPFFAKAAGRGTAFADLDEGLLRQADKAALVSGAPRPECGLAGPGVDRDMSVALVQEGEIRAFVAFDRSCCGGLTLAAAWSGKAGPAALPALLGSAFVRGQEKYPPDTLLAVQAVNRASAALIKKLIPGAKPLSRRFVRPWIPPAPPAETGLEDVPDVDEDVPDVDMEAVFAAEP